MKHKYQVGSPAKSKSTGLSGVIVKLAEWSTGTFVYRIEPSGKPKEGRWFMERDVELLVVAGSAPVVAESAPVIAESAPFVAESAPVIED